jgi:hypothetical protein
MVALLLVAAVAVASHGHLRDANHDQRCAACTLAEARTLAATPPAAPPAPVAMVLLLPRITVGTTPHARPPLDSAPKHGPPAPLV